ncbi:hypothetical protein N0V90_006668 [Kalmusia sp. IMI 367209]|nr:hypothetical protein N0V90_006668 [Kalmusia sp. IMI 367209]
MIGLPFLPRSPRWLAKVDRSEEAIHVLANIQASGDVQSPYVIAEYEEIVAVLNAERQAPAGWRKFVYNGMWKRTLAGFSVQAWQQLSGANVMTYYADLSGNVNLLSSGVQYALFIIFSTATFFFVDKVGRRTLLVYGAIAMGICHFVVGGTLGAHYTYAPEGVHGEKNVVMKVTGGPAHTVIAFSYLLIIIYALTLAPICWVYAAEVWSLETRATGMGIAAIGNWLFNFAIGLFIPPAFLNIRWKLFIVFGVMCVAAAVQFYFTYPETCGKTIEEIEVMFSKDGPHAWKTNKGHSRLDQEVQAVVNAQAKNEARASIENVVQKDKGTTAEAMEHKTETQYCILPPPAERPHPTSGHMAELLQPERQLSAYPTDSADDPKDSFDQESFNELDAVGFREILDQDPRPTFVLDLDSDHLDYKETKETIRPIFCNAALRLHDRLLDKVSGSDIENSLEVSDQVSYHNFKSWASGVSKFDDSRDVFPQTFLHEGMLWTGSTIRQRWRIVSGIQWHDASLPAKGELFYQNIRGGVAAEEESKKNTVGRLRKSSITATAAFSEQALRAVPSEIDPTVKSSTLVSTAPPFTKGTKALSSGPTNSGGASNDTAGSGSSVQLASPENGVPDWTGAQPRGQLTEHMIFTRSVDWGATPLGPMSNWSVQFREIANLVMRNPHPAALFWGEELTMLYNEAYKNEVAGNKHPELMGTGFSGPFSEIWEGVSPVFRECARTGQSVRKENDYLPIERYGYLEETFFSWSFTPVYGGTERILGFYNAPFESTYQTISHRRLQTLRQLGEKLAETRSIKHFWQCVLDGLQDNPYEVPFALLYSINDSDDADTASHSSDSTISMKCCLLEGAIGIPDGHPASPPKLDLKRSKEGFIPAVREAMRTREPTTLNSRNGSLPEELIEGIEWRGYGDPCKEAIIIPVRPTNGENIFAFLLIGVNSRRAYDDEYRAFVHMLNRQLANSLASFLLFEEEVRRNRNAAEVATLQREQLTRQLELQASRMRRMTELSPLGMYLFSSDGVLLEANERYYEMTGHGRDDNSPFAFLGLMEDESRQKAEAMWRDHLTDSTLRQEELQLKNTGIVPRDLSGEPMQYWVLATSQPEIGADGKVRSIMGSIADISHIKWAQGLQDQRLREAEETKRQQNEFIDITSHEMRNPLSAILICADDIRESLSKHHFATTDAKVIEECIEAANNIALCVQHQKSIVDDILTVSKLDSNLLLITPVPVQPATIIHRAMSMFKPEVQAKDIEFSFHAHESLRSLEVDWVNLDPSRLLQITVNLITNAIKFTAGSSERAISVHLGATREQPEVQIKGFEYVPTRSSLINITAGEDWGEGERLYIRIRVDDTGCGLTKDEKRLLFERFAQASPRTHATYGGSGLGLFISRQLAELHGGQIGVSSEAGVGSTFGFFIQGRRAAAPKRPGIMGPAPLLGHLGPTVPQASIRSNPSPASIPLSVAEKEPPLDASDLAILIVEDNLVNQRVLSRQLQKSGCTVYTADNGLLALEVLATTSFQDPAGRPLSIILMDLEMPEMDGLTAVRRIRDMEGKGMLKGHVPVIAVTANVRDEQMKTALEGGMDDVVSKPFRVPDLLEKIRSVLARLGGGE